MFQRRGQVLFAVRFTVNGRVKWKHGFRKLDDAKDFVNQTKPQEWEYLELHDGEYVSIR